MNLFVSLLMMLFQFMPYPGAGIGTGGGGGGGDTAFITAPQTTSTRNNFAGSVGYKFTVGGSNITVTAVGRYVLSGNSATHVVTITRDSDQVDIASATVVTSGVTAGTFAYTTLGTPIVLTSGASYYCTTAETNGGDLWLDNGLVSHGSEASITNEQYFTAGSWSAGSTANSSFGTPTFKSH